MIFTSVGMIGGADGPTSILISGSHAPVWWILGIIVPVAAFFILQRRKKH